MTRFLWTGESEYCICGHHLTDHETSQSFVAIAAQEPPTVTCIGGNKSHPIRNCECDEFRPFRVVSQQDDDEDTNENRNSQVRTE